MGYAKYGMTTLTEYAKSPHVVDATDDHNIEIDLDKTKAKDYKPYTKPKDLPDSNPIKKAVVENTSNSWFGKKMVESSSKKVRFNKKHGRYEPNVKNNGIAVCTRCGARLKARWSKNGPMGNCMWCSQHDKSKQYFDAKKGTGWKERVVAPRWRGGHKGRGRRRYH